MPNQDELVMMFEEMNANRETINDEWAYNFEWLYGAVTPE